MARVVTAVATGLFVGTLSTVVPVAIWPGEAELTAPLFCPAATDPMVVSDTFHDSEGTSTNYTLYCVGEHGTLTDEGFVLPMLVMLTAHVLIVAALVLLATAFTGKKEPVRDQPAPAPSPAEPNPHNRVEDYFER